jgi:hypothetical protein
MIQIIDVKNAQFQLGVKAIRIFFRAFQRICTRSGIISPDRVGAFLLACSILLATGPQVLVAQQADQPTSQSAGQTAQGTPEELQQLVAPIALYPDALVAQILAASTYPTQVVEADRWLQKHSKPNGDKQDKDVDKQSWDPSVKALTQFPSVLANMDTNLSWTSALGDAYFNQRQDVMTAIQVMRERAQAAGTLKSTPQQTVTTQGQTIVIEPAEPQVVYVPTYDPWLVYGAPLPIFPGYYYDGFLDYPYVSFGLGIGIGLGLGFGWGWHSWGFDWGHHDVVFNHAPFVSHSHIFANRSGIMGGHGDFRGFDRGPGFDRGQGLANHDIGRDSIGRSPTPSIGSDQHDLRGFGQARSDAGSRSGAFSGFGEGGNERGFLSRGESSFGGGHGFGFGGGHGFGSGMRGGGGGHR